MIAAHLFALAAIAKALASSEAPPLAIEPALALAQEDDERPHVHNSAVPA